MTAGADAPPRLFYLCDVQPNGTRGHIDVPLTWDQARPVLGVLSRAGIREREYLLVSAAVLPHWLAVR